jgi:hypothetical protein
MVRAAYSPAAEGRSELATFVRPAPGIVGHGLVR